MSTAQKMTALQRANEVRLEAGAYLRDVQYGRRTAAEILRDPPDCLTNYAVAVLLRRQRRWGITRTRRLLAEFHIGDLRRIGELTDRQRRLLAERLS